MWILEIWLHYNAIHIFVHKSVGIMHWISQDCGFQKVLLAVTSEISFDYYYKLGKTSGAHLILECCVFAIKVQFYGLYVNF